MSAVETVEIVYAHHYGEHVPGDVEHVAPSRARDLIRAGKARLVPEQPASTPARVSKASRASRASRASIPS